MTHSTQLKLAFDIQLQDSQLIMEQVLKKTKRMYFSQML